MPASSCWLLASRKKLDGAEDANGKHEDSGDEGEDSGDGNSDDAEGQADQPDDWVEDERHEGQGPAEDEKNAEKQEFEHNGPFRRVELRSCTCRKNTRTDAGWFRASGWKAGAVSGAGLQRVVAVDWSGDRSEAGQRKKIWAGVWTMDPTRDGKAVTNGAPMNPPKRGLDGAPDAFGGRVTLEGGRTRSEMAAWLIAMARETPRMVVGFDFCFSFPAWFVRGEMGCADAPAFWELVEREHGERWLAAGCTDGRFWGRPGVSRGKRPEEFSGERLHRMLRATDIDCKIAAVIPEAERAARVRGITPKSVFQIGGAGAVGTASLRGMPVLRRLREAGFAVWPFDRPALREGRPLVVEMYTRLNTGAVRKSNAEARAEYLRRKRAEDAGYCGLSRRVLEKARASEDAFDALVSCMVMAARREEFAELAEPKDAEFRVEGWTWAPGVERD